jgi:hypothetical protein
MDENNDKHEEQNDLDSNNLEELLEIEEDEEFSPYLEKDSRIAKEDEITDETLLKLASGGAKKNKKRSRKTPKRLRFSSKQKKIDKPKREFVSPTVLSPKEHEINQVKSGLTEFYKNNLHFLKNGISIEDQINNIIEECKNGWVCCPKTFIKRVEWKTKWNSSALRTRLDYQDSYYNAKQIQLQKDLKKTEDSGLYPGVSAISLRKKLNPEERKFWQEREAYYRKEFEFNDSSDWSLLMQVLLEELTQKRLVERRLADPYDDIEFPLSESYKRLLNAQRALGITRDQRENAANETEGNIAQLSVIFEEKEKLIGKIRERDRIEEEAMMAKKNNGDALSLLPEDLARALSKGDVSEEVPVDEFEEIGDKSATVEIKEANKAQDS